jgi:hypothetical protein
VTGSRVSVAVTRDQALPVTLLKRLGIFRGAGGGGGAVKGSAVISGTMSGCGAGGIRCTGGGATKGFSAGAVRWAAGCGIGWDRAGWAVMAGWAIAAWGAAIAGWVIRASATGVVAGA